MSRQVDPDGLSIPAGPYRLRPTLPADRGGIAAAGAAPSIGGRMPWFPSPFPAHYADGWIERAVGEWGAGRHFVLSIVDDADAYLGSVVLSVLPDDVLELTYWVLPSAEGRGVATASAKAAVDWAETTIRPHHVFAKTRPDATASQRVLAKAGFAQTGADPHPTFERRIG